VADELLPLCRGSDAARTRFRSHRRGIDLARARGMRRVIAAITAAAFLSGCVSNLLRQGTRERPRREAGLVIGGAVLEAAAAAVVYEGVTHPSAGANDCDEPCDYVAETGKGLAGLLFAAALAVLLAGSAVADLGVGTLQLATGRYVRATQLPAVHADVHVIDDEITLDGTPIATPDALAVALRARHPDSVLIAPSAGIDCATLQPVIDAVTSAGVDSVELTHGCAGEP
jgi:hypothetical protein